MFNFGTNKIEENKKAKNMKGITWEKLKKDALKA